MTARTRIALFDLDHTLLPIDSDHSWGVFTQRIGWTDPEEFTRRNDEFFAHYKAGTLDIHEYVRFAVDAVRRKGSEAAARAHEQFMREVVGPEIRPEALALVEQRDARLLLCAHSFSSIDLISGMVIARCVCRA